MISNSYQHTTNTTNTCAITGSVDSLITTNMAIGIIYNDLVGNDKSVWILRFGPFDVQDLFGVSAWIIVDYVRDVACIDNVGFF